MAARRIDMKSRFPKHGSRLIPLAWSRLSLSTSGHPHLVSATIKLGETLLFDSYDVASLGAHMWAAWAAEPLDRDSRDVISEHLIWITSSWRTNVSDLRT